MRLTRFLEAAAANTIRNVLSAVDYLQRQQICHRDLKLENLVLKEPIGVRAFPNGRSRLGRAPRAHNRVYRGCNGTESGDAAHGGGPC